MTTSALRIVTPAASLPVTVDEAKGQLRVTHAYEDTTIQRIVKAASRWAEEQTRRIFCTTVVEIRMDRFPYRNEYCSLLLYDDYRVEGHYKYGRVRTRTARDSAIRLPGGMVSAVDEIRYLDTSSIEQTLTGPTSGTPGTDYQEDLTDADEAFVFTARNSDWPSTADETINAVTIQYQVGYGADPEDVPEDIRQAILFRCTDMFVNRDGTKGDATVAAENLLQPHRIFAL